jgi:hypothetical protein
MGAAVIAAAAHRAEREIIEHLQDAGATTPERAVPLHDLPPLGRRRLQRLLNARVVQETPAGFWLDEPAYADYRTDRRTVALVLLAIVTTAAIGMLLTQVI